MLKQHVGAPSSAGPVPDMIALGARSNGAALRGDFDEIATGSGTHAQGVHDQLVRELAEIELSSRRCGRPSRRSNRGRRHR